MKLKEKLELLNGSNALVEFEDLLSPDRRFDVTISWNGRGVVVIDGFEGGVDIDFLASKYLILSSVFKDDPTISERCACLNLLQRIKQLYLKRDMALKETLLFWAIVPLIENSLCDRQGYLDQTRLLSFSPKEYKDLWPNQTPANGTCATINHKGEVVSESWLATETMLFSLLQK